MQRTNFPFMKGTFRAVAALTLALTLSACGTTFDPGSLARQLTGATPAPPAPATTTTATDQNQQDAVKQVIERANQAQATAFNANNPSAMKDNATDSFYTQLVQTNRELAASGVTRIDIVSTDFQNVT